MYIVADQMIFCAQPYYKKYLHVRCEGALACQKLQRLRQNDILKLYQKNMRNAKSAFSKYFFYKYENENGNKSNIMIYLWNQKCKL
jgi:hypothetical protein